MLIYLNNINHISNDYKPPYFLFGNERWIIEQIKQKIYSIARMNCTYTQSFELDNNLSSWQELLSISQTNDLFSGQSLIYATVSTLKINKFSPIIQIIIKQNANIIFILPKLDKITKQSTWFTQIETQINCIQIPNIDANNIIYWLSNIKQNLNLNIDKHTIEWLATQFYGNISGAFQQLQVLSLAYQKEYISLKQVQEAILNVADYQSYDLINACMAGDILLAKKTSAFLNNANIILVIWLLIEELLLLIEIHFQMKMNKNLTEIFKNLKIWGDRQHSLALAIQRIKLDKLEQFLMQAYQLEQEAKGLNVHNNVYNNLLLLCFSICVSN